MKKSISKENRVSEGGYSSPINNTNPPPVILGKIYADWCGHCNTLAPKWEIIKKKLKNKFPHNSPPMVYKVEGAEIDDTKKGLETLRPYLANPSEKVELQEGYPTIFKIVNGHLSYYEGPREVDPIIMWVMEGIKPSNTRKMKSRQSRKGRKQRRSRRTRRL